MASTELAKIEDVERLVELLVILFQQDIEFVPDPEKQKEGLRQIIENPAMGEILTIRKDNEIVGMVSLLYSVSTALGGTVAVLEDMVIAPEFRQKGLGTELLQRAIAYAKENGILRITLLTDFDNDVAIKYYEQNGFTKSAMIPLRQVF